LIRTLVRSVVSAISSLSEP